MTHAHLPLARRLTLAALCAAITLSAAPACADDASDGMAIAGGQAGGQNSTYGLGGVILPLPGSKLGDGWVARVFAEEISYRYKAGARSVDGNAEGGAATVGYQWSDCDGWLGAYAGPDYRYTHLSPDDPTNDARGSAVGARLQLEGERNITQDFKVNANATYEAFNNDAYWSRLRLLYRLDGPMYAGPEGGYQGDDNYKAWSAGVSLVGIQLAKNTSLGIDTGVRKTQGYSASPYGGLELGVTFR